MRKKLLTLLLVLLAPLVYAENIKAPSFTLTDVDGEEVTLPRTHDGVDVYLFWASWCPYCKALMPYLQQMKIEYGDKLTIYALNVRDDEMPESFMAEKGYDFVSIPEADSVMKRYGVRPIPAVFLVDGQGKIRFNLYELMLNDSSEFEAMSHGEKATRRAPYWSGEIRKTIDHILNESRQSSN